METHATYNDAELALRFVEGDRRALDQVYQRFYRPLAYFAYQLTNNMQQSEDIAAVSLIKIWERRQDFNELKSIKSFLYTASKNAALDYLKAQKVRANASASLRHDIEENEDQINAFQVEAELLQHIYDSIGALPAKARQVFTMIYIDGLTVEAIAERLNMPVQTVRNNKSRAIELLRIELIRRNVSPAVFFMFSLGCGSLYS